MHTENPALPESAAASVDWQQQAPEAYLNMLRQHGAASRDLALRKHFLNYLLPELEQQPVAADSYRRAADQTLQRFAGTESVHVCQATIREFYYFWIGDVRQIALLHKHRALTPKPARFDIQGSLTDMLAAMDQSGWDVQALPALSSYLQALRSLGVSQATLDVRERVLRLLLFVMREHDASATVFRSAVDALSALFSKEEAKSKFIEMARDFFYHWIDYQSSEDAISEPAPDLPDTKNILF